MEKPNYYGILPANVRYDKELKPNAKLLYSEFTCLATKEGYCFSSNNYFAELYGVDPSTISKWIKQLADKGYIRLEYIYDGKECKERRIYITSKIENVSKEKTDKEKSESIADTEIGIAPDARGVLPTVQGGYCQKVKGNNTSNNNTRVNNIYSEKEKSPCVQVEEKYLENYKKLYEQNRFESEKPLFWDSDFGKRRKFINNLLKDVSLDKIFTVLDKAMKDNWCLNELSYDLYKILCKTNFNSLYNAKETKTRKSGLMKSDQFQEGELDNFTGFGK